MSRPALLESRFSTVICAPIYSSHEGLSTQMAVGIGEGLKVAALPPGKLAELKQALRVALDVED